MRGCDLLSMKSDAESVAATATDVTTLALMPVKMYRACQLVKRPTVAKAMTDARMPMNAYWRTFQRRACLTVSSPKPSEEGACARSSSFRGGAETPAYFWS